MAREKSVSIFKEHDFECTFDVAIDNKDLTSAIHIRNKFDNFAGSKIRHEIVNRSEAEVLKHQKSLCSEILSYLKKKRMPVQPNKYMYPHIWYEKDSRQDKSRVYGLGNVPNIF